MTALKVKNAGPGVHSDGRGLILRVKSSGARSWVLRVQHQGVRRDVGLGSDADLTLAEARDKAAHLRKLARQGKDPVRERDRAKVIIPTFAEAAEQAHDQLGKGWADKTAQQFKASLGEHAKSLASLRVDQITPADVIAALAPIWRAKPQMARKVRHRILAVLSFAKSHGWRSAPVPVAEELRRGLGNQPRSRSFAAVPYADIPELVKAELAKAESPARLALLFTIFTAARSGEVRRAQWAQIDREARTWSRPAEMMKSAAPHTATLSPAALVILERAAALYGEEGLVFPPMRGDGVLSDMSLAKILRTAGRTETVHGFRSSFRDWAAEQMPQVPAMVAEMALAHSVGDATVEAYLRSDLRALRQGLMDAWGAFVAPGASGAADG